MSERGRSRSDSSAKAARNDLLIKVTLLDGEEKSFTADRRANASVVIDRVLSDLLDIDEKEYFSLYYLDNNHRMFLDPSKPLKKLMPDSSAANLDLRFGVKFYVHNPDILKRDTTRYLYMLQVCRDIRENRILVDADDASNLAALLLQTNVGDYNPAEHMPGYSLDFLKLLYSTTDHLPSRYEQSLIELHKQHQGLNPDQADMKFLMLAKDMRRYGQQLYAVYDNKGDVIHLGVSCTGIALHRNNVPISQHVWPNVVKVSYRKRKFRIKYREARQDSDDTTNPVLLTELRCGEPPASKRLWKACVEQHTFFRLNRPELPIRRPSFLLRRGSRFRYSGGRTLQQMQTANYPRKEGNIVRTYSLRYGKEADNRNKTNIHCYTITKSSDEDCWQLQEATGANQYSMAVDKEVKRRQLAGNFNQQKVFSLLKLEGAETPLLSSQTKFVVKRSEVTGNYELEPTAGPTPSASVQGVSSWENSQGATVTLEPAPSSNGDAQFSTPPEPEEPSAPVESPMTFHEFGFQNPVVVGLEISTTFQTTVVDGPSKESSVIRSYSENEDITPEINKLDEVMSSITSEMEADSSLAATVVTAFLRRQHALYQTDETN